MSAGELAYGVFTIICCLGFYAWGVLNGIKDNQKYEASKLMKMQRDYMDQRRK